MRPSFDESYQRRRRPQRLSYSSAPISDLAGSVGKNRERHPSTIFSSPSKAQKNGSKYPHRNSFLPQNVMRAPEGMIVCIALSMRRVPTKGFENRWTAQMVLFSVEGPTSVGDVGRKIGQKF